MIYNRKNQPRGIRVTTAIATLMTGVALSALLMPTQLAAQTGTKPVADQTASFNIPAQKLSSALVAFSRQSNIEVFAESSVTEGKLSSPVAGMAGPFEALNQLLRNTGLTYEVSNPSTVRIVDPSAAASRKDGTVMLGTLMVGGRTESAWGPGDGFFSSRSAAGTKTDTSIMETPQTVSVVTREEMDAQAAQTLPQALRYVPGVLTERNGADERTDFIYSRGFELEQYLDGTRIIPGVWTTAKTESFGLERIDVLKGPASVLYGQASPGGIASLISKRPTDEPYNEVSIETGSYNRVQGTVDLSGPIDEEGKFLYRLTGLIRDTDTQVNHVREHREFLAPAFTWRPDSDTELTILTQYMHDPELGLYYKLPALGTLLSNPNGKIPIDFHSGDPSFDKQERTQYSAGYNFMRNLSDVFTFRQNARYTRVEGDFNILVVQSLQADNHTINRMAYSAQETTDTFTVDTQLEAAFETGQIEHTVIGGVDYQLLDSDRVDGFGAAPTIDFLAPVYYQTIAPTTPFLANNQRNDQIGVYLQDQIKLGGLSLVLGGRHDWAESETKNHIASSVTKQSDTAFTWRAGLLYSFDSGIAPYASYSESFEPVSGTDFFGTPFEPTTGQQYEAGIKYQAPGTRSLLTLSAFHLTQQNVPTADPDPAHPFAQVQTGETTSEGFEAEAKIAITDAMTFIGSYSHVDVEITKSNDGLLGFTPVYQPEDVASAWLDYTFHRGALRGLRAGAGVRYVGSSYGTATNTLEVPSYTLVDAGVSYDFGVLDASLKGVQLSVNAKNLFDKEYVAGCQNINTCYYGPLQTVTAKLSYQW